MQLVHYVVIKVGGDDRVLNIRTTIDQDDLLDGELMLNGGWTKPKQMLSHLSYYFRYTDDGHTRINRAHLDRPMTSLDRLIAVVEIAPWMVWLIFGVAALTLATFALILAHVVFGLV